MNKFIDSKKYRTTLIILVLILVFTVLFSRVLNKNHGLQTLYSFITTPSRNTVDVSTDTSGSISWKQLAATKMKFKQTNTGEDLAPDYGSDLIALNHHDVSIKGFMFPLEASSKQTHFLLSPYSPSCPFCLPAGANELIEVRPTELVNIYGRSVMVKGQFELLTEQSDLHGGMLYRINNATVE